ncbi:Thiol-disulfide oxidoreductase ResA [Planctomycetes bacterium Pan216]|uniref:Thiol-disulfide oxidoreductase ResA n=1 Tax=Kolteria novifilia TaxID=2527975 RepID=A0A518BB98_9BACT|nr:Thiol-disulfide oxidoreductase ResA [Planctomycetes bacterium Pan216]
MRSQVTVLVAGLLLLVSAKVASAVPEPAIGRTVSDFTLRDGQGKEHRLSALTRRGPVAVVFLGTECPLVKLYIPKLEQLHQKFAPKGVTILGINANAQDSPEEIAAFAKEHRLSFPVLRDPDAHVADHFAAKRTPEAFVLDQERKVRYQGRIDDQFYVGTLRSEPTRRDLAVALGEILAGEEVTVASTPVEGCFIGRRRQPKADAAVTYAKDVAPIFNRRCVECHREGQVAPFAMTSAEEVAPWAETILEVIEDRRMPPWHASPDHGTFANEARMPAEEIETVRRWVEAGTPLGDPKEMPEPLQFAEGWRIEEPETIFSLPEEVTIPAEGEVAYKYFTVDPGFTEDRWIRQAEAKPGNPAIVHHIIVYVVEPKGGLLWKRKRSMLVATAPGARPLRLEEGIAKRIPAGSLLVFQMHYTPNGSVQTDRSSVGLVFADPKTVKREVLTRGVSNRRFRIEPGASDHRVEASRHFGSEGKILSLFPHMHLRGKSFRYEAIHPDGKREILLDVPRYDFNWQNSYILSTPRSMPKGSVLQCVAYYDNSASNLANPDPTKVVTWGDQTDDEMMIGYYDVLRDVSSGARTPPPSTPSREVSDATLLELAESSLQTSDGFEAFSAALERRVPLLDRICLTTADGGTLEIVYAEQKREFSKIPGAGFRRSMTWGFALPKYAQREEPIQHDDLTQASGYELKLLSRRLGSSYHVPLLYQGKPATLNFWSRKQKAFSPEVTTLLKDVATRAASKVAVQ